MPKHSNYFKGKLLKTITTKFNTYIYIAVTLVVLVVNKLSMCNDLHSINHVILYSFVFQNWVFQSCR